MNVFAAAALLATFLLAPILGAQEIETSPVTGGRSLEGGLVAPETPLLVLHVPVSLQAISTGVTGAYVHCEVLVNPPNTTERFSLYRNRRLSLTDRAYEGVVSFYFEEPPPASPQAWRTDDLLLYTCRLLLCGTGVFATSQYEGVPGSCERPAVPIGEGGGTSVGSSASALAPDLNAPYQFTVQGRLRED